MMEEFDPHIQVTDLDEVPVFNNSSLQLRQDAEDSALRREYTTELPTYYDNGMPPTEYRDSSFSEPSTSSSRNETMVKEIEAERVIATQPGLYEQFPGQRRPIPIYTLDWQSTAHSQFVPRSGLDFLAGVQIVHINETVQDLYNSGYTNNRYTVKIPGGETLYAAHENSSEIQKSCFGSGRKFNMKLLDPSMQEAVSFIRHLGCSVGCCGCCLQGMEIYTSPGVFLGRIEQEFSFASNASFSLRDSGYNLVFRIEGPRSLPCFMYKDSTFKIMSRDSQGSLGTIMRKWDQNDCDYYLEVVFPGSATPEEHKALILATAFLIEYTYFEERKKCLFGIC